MLQLSHRTLFMYLQLGWVIGDEGPVLAGEALFASRVRAIVGSFKQCHIQQWRMMDG